MFDFSCGAAGLGSGLVTAAAWVTAIVQFLALAQELSQHTNTAKKKKGHVPKLRQKCHFHAIERDGFRCFQGTVLRASVNQRIMSPLSPNSEKPYFEALRIRV